MKRKLSFRLSKPLLIEGRREWLLFFAAAFTLFLLSLSRQYLQYRTLVSQKKRAVEAEVLVQYAKTKKGRAYQVLKLHSDALGKDFFTTSKEPLKNLRGRRVALLLFPKKVGFVDFLRTPFIPAYILRVLPGQSLRFRLYDHIAAQHPERWMQELYGALFLALPVSKDLRQAVTKLGANHLLALSGFHMGVLWFILYGGLSLLYRPLQNRFFPWRHRLLDVGAVTVGVLGGYLLLTGMPPSLLRAYAMVVTGWLALLFGIELLSFSFLAVCAVALVALIPSLLFSIGFWLSVWGVFSIYQFLRWTEGWPAWVVFLGLNLWVWLAMLPVVHTLFGTFAPSQLFSPLLTLLFTLFYPVAMALNLLGAGGLMDGMVMELLRYGAQVPAVTVTLPRWVGGLFVLLALFAVRFRVALYLQMGVMLLFLLYLVEKVA
ncbi:ComEC/Rec2 family competence protein [Hydrogenimonas sp. SS33]|uniref:ComEC/Rec2 family competence protein n=1 Tax=Hydrogenimonas leucolamina TaxID=2954236 RepID=UPI00336BF9ED